MTSSRYEDDGGIVLIIYGHRGWLGIQSFSCFQLSNAATDKLMYGTAECAKRDSHVGHAKAISEEQGPHEAPDTHPSKDHTFQVVCGTSVPSDKFGMQASRACHLRRVHYHRRDRGRIEPGARPGARAATQGMRGAGSMMPCDLEPWQECVHDPPSSPAHHPQPEEASHASMEWVCLGYCHPSLPACAPPSVVWATLTPA